MACPSTPHTWISKNSSTFFYRFISQFFAYAGFQVILLRPSVAWAHYFCDGSPGEDGARGVGTDGCLVVGASSG